MGRLFLRSIQSCVQHSYLDFKYLKEIKSLICLDGKQWFTFMWASLPLFWQSFEVFGPVEAQVILSVTTTIRSSFNPSPRFQVGLHTVKATLQ